VLRRPEKPVNSGFFATRSASPDSHFQVRDDHRLRRSCRFARPAIKAFYSDIGRPSVDPELVIRTLLVGYCYGIRHKRRLCQEMASHLAYRWFGKLDLDDNHSTFSVNRLGRFRESEILRHVFERVVAAAWLRVSSSVRDSPWMRA
jgi:transposase-like protein DUF772